MKASKNLQQEQLQIYKSQKLPNSFFTFIIEFGFMYVFSLVLQFYFF